MVTRSGPDAVRNQCADILAKTGLAYRQDEIDQMDIFYRSGHRTVNILRLLCS